MSGVKGRTGIYKRTEEHKLRVLESGFKTRFVKGHKMSEEVIEKIRLALKGKKKEKVYYGDKAPAWKGDKVGYRGIHSWLEDNYGKPAKCENCGTTKAKRYEWSNNSGLLKRDRDDWERLCVKCHRLKDGWVDKVAKKNWRVNTI